MIALRFPLGSLVVVLFVSPLAAEPRVTLIAGGGDDPNGTAATPGIPGSNAIKLNEPFGVDFAPRRRPWAGSMYIIEMGHRLLRVSSNGKAPLGPERAGPEIQVLAGDGTPGNNGDREPASRARLNGPHSIAVARDGRVYIADTWNHRIRYYDQSTNLIHHFAGSPTGEKGFGGDGGPAATCLFGDTYCIAFTPGEKELLVADLDNRRIRSIDMKSGIVTTIAGNGQKGVPDDGTLATQAPLVDPRAVAADESGNVFILERSGHALRAVGRNKKAPGYGEISTVAGTGKPGPSTHELSTPQQGKEGQRALEAQLNGPKHLCLDRDGSILIADTENHLIRRYSPRTGVITHVAGTGKPGSKGPTAPGPEHAMPANQVELNRPHGVWIGPDESLYISDSSNHRILRLEK